MSVNILKTKIMLRRDTEENFNKVADTLVLLKGEVVIVDTSSGEVRLKIGDGMSVYKDVPFFYGDRTDDSIVRGYYHENAFYVDPSYKEKYVAYENKLYVDNPSHNVYCYDATSKLYYAIKAPLASDTEPGIAKLYNTLGDELDGSITQWRITTEIKKKFEVAADDETLVFK